MTKTMLLLGLMILVRVFFAFTSQFYLSVLPLSFALY